jgi:hypothetical protein
MGKLREINQNEANPVLADLINQAKVDGHLVLRYEGATYALMPVEDLTHTFTDEELKEFALAWAEAEEPTKQLTSEQALQRSLAELASDE